MFNESICHFSGIGSIMSLLFYFCGKMTLANNIDPDQTPHNVASDLGLRCLPLILLRVCRSKWVKGKRSKFIPYRIGPH